ncbi:hypothetical protein KIPB_008308, partial [Kipferlia bialata]|eukprot:g8308.t1
MSGGRLVCVRVLSDRTCVTEDVTDCLLGTDGVPASDKDPIVGIRFSADVGRVYVSTACTLSVLSMQTRRGGIPTLCLLASLPQEGASTYVHNNSKALLLCQRDYVRGYMLLEDEDVQRRSGKFAVRPEVSMGGLERRLIRSPSMIMPSSLPALALCAPVRCPLDTVLASSVVGSCLLVVGAKGGAVSVSLVQPVPSVLSPAMAPVTLSCQVSEDIAPSDVFLLPLPSVQPLVPVHPDRQLLRRRHLLVLPGSVPILLEGVTLEAHTGHLVRGLAQEKGRDIDVGGGQRGWGCESGEPGDRSQLVKQLTSLYRRKRYGHTFSAAAGAWILANGMASPLAIHVTPSPPVGSDVDVPEPAEPAPPSPSVPVPEGQEGTEEGVGVDAYMRVDEMEREHQLWRCVGVVGTQRSDGGQGQVVQSRRRGDVLSLSVTPCPCLTPNLPPTLSSVRGLPPLSLDRETQVVSMSVGTGVCAAGSPVCVHRDRVCVVTHTAKTNTYSLVVLPLSLNTLKVDKHGLLRAKGLATVPLAFPPDTAVGATPTYPALCCIVSGGDTLYMSVSGMGCVYRVPIPEAVLADPTSQSPASPCTLQTLHTLDRGAEVAGVSASHGLLVVRCAEYTVVLETETDTETETYPPMDTLSVCLRLDGKYRSVSIQSRSVLTATAPSSVSVHTLTRAHDTPGSDPLKALLLHAPQAVRGMSQTVRADVPGMNRLLGSVCVGEYVLVLGSDSITGGGSISHRLCILVYDWEGDKVCHWRLPETLLPTRISTLSTIPVIEATSPSLSPTLLSAYAPPLLVLTSGSGVGIGSLSVPIEVFKFRLDCIAKGSSHIVCDKANLFGGWLFPPLPSPSIECLGPAMNDLPDCYASMLSPVLVQAYSEYRRPLGTGCVPGAIAQLGIHAQAQINPNVRGGLIQAVQSVLTLPCTQPGGDAVPSLVVTEAAQEQEGRAPWVRNNSIMDHPGILSLVTSSPAHIRSCVCVNVHLGEGQGQVCAVIPGPGGHKGGVMVFSDVSDAREREMCRVSVCDPSPSHGWEGVCRILSVIPYDVGYAILGEVGEGAESGGGSVSSLPPSSVCLCLCSVQGDIGYESLVVHHRADYALPAHLQTEALSLASREAEGCYTPLPPFCPSAPPTEWWIGSTTGTGPSLICTPLPFLDRFRQAILPFRRRLSRHVLSLLDHMSHEAVLDVLAQACKGVGLVVDSDTASVLVSETVSALLQCGNVSPTVDAGVYALAAWLLKRFVGQAGSLSTWARQVHAFAAHRCLGSLAPCIPVTFRHPSDPSRPAKLYSAVLAVLAVQDPVSLERVLDMWVQAGVASYSEVGPGLCVMADGAQRVGRGVPDSFRRILFRYYDGRGLHHMALKSLLACSHEDTPSAPGTPSVSATEYVRQHPRLSTVAVYGHVASLLYLDPAGAASLFASMPEALCPVQAVVESTVKLGLSLLAGGRGGNLTRGVDAASPAELYTAAHRLLCHRDGALAGPVSLGCRAVLGKGQEGMLNAGDFTYPLYLYLSAVCKMKGGPLRLKGLHASAVALSLRHAASDEDVRDVIALCTDVPLTDTVSMAQEAGRPACLDTLYLRCADAADAAQAEANTETAQEGTSVSAPDSPRETVPVSSGHPLRRQAVFCLLDGGSIDRAFTLVARLGREGKGGDLWDDAIMHAAAAGLGAQVLQRCVEGSFPVAITTVSDILRHIDTDHIIPGFDRSLVALGLYGATGVYFWRSLEGMSRTHMLHLLRQLVTQKGRGRRVEGADQCVFCERPLVVAGAGETQ